MALIVTDPREKEAPWVVIVAPCHLTSLMQTLQSRPRKRKSLAGLECLSWYRGQSSGRALNAAHIPPVGTNLSAIAPSMNQEVVLHECG